MNSSLKEQFVPSLFALSSYQREEANLMMPLALNQDPEFFLGITL
jgi:hypothetical protein